MGPNKTKETPPWSPSALEDVTDEIVDRFFEHGSPYLRGAPVLEIPEGMEPHYEPRKYSLPTEREIGEVVRGSLPLAGSMSLQLEDVLEHFAHARKGKLGVREKILEVAQRKCELVDNNDGNFVWLQWKN